MSTVLGADTALAGLGFVAMTAMQFLGRISGDRLVDKFGHRCVARAGAVSTLLGSTLALLVPSVPSAIIGFGFAGLGIATLVPSVLHTADEIPGLQPGTGLAVANWLMRFGSLAAPPAVGILADIVGLRAGLVLLPVSALVVLARARLLPRLQHSVALRSR